MLRTTPAAAWPVVGTAAAGAQVVPTRSPSAIALTACEVGSGRDDKGAAPGNVGWALERRKIDWLPPWHPGAVRAPTEAGVWEAEHDAPNEALLKRQQVLQMACRGFVAGAPTDAEAFAAAWLKARADALKAANLPVIFGS